MSNNTIHTWNTGQLNYYFNNFCADLGKDGTIDNIMQAFDVWKPFVPLTFQNVLDLSDADIVFYFDQDGFNPGQLAYQITLTGEIHFNETLTWSSTVSPNGFDLISVAAHEIGHVFGLSHFVGNSLMSELQNGMQHLGESDKKAIESIFSKFVNPVPGWFGVECQGGGVAVTDLNWNGTPDLIVFHIDNPSGGNRGYYRVGWDMDSNGNVTRGWTEPIAIPGWFGNESQAGGIAVANLNGNRSPDLLVFHIDNPGGGNSGYYRIGWDLDDTGHAAGGWSEHRRIPGWFGDESQHGGIAIADLNGSGSLDLIVFHIDNPVGANRGYIRIGRDLDVHGLPMGGWTEPIPVPGWFGSNTQGAGIAVADLNGNGNFDIIVFHIDNPSGDNHGYYSVGWNLDSDGNVNGGWTNPLLIEGWFGTETQGGGIALTDLNGDSRFELIVYHIDNSEDENHGYYRVIKSIDNSQIVYQVPGWFGAQNQGGGVAVTNLNRSEKPDLIVFHIDNPGGANRGYYRVGWDIDNFGYASGGWTGPIVVPGWFGDETQASGIAVADLNGNGRPDLIVFHIDNPGGGNSGYYRIGWDLDDTGHAVGGWSENRRIPGWFGDESQHGGIAIADMNGSGSLDLIVFHIDNPVGENHGYFRIGKDLDVHGLPMGGWTEPIPVPGWFGSNTQGSGIAIADLNGWAEPDLIVFNIVNLKGDNHGCLRAGWNLENNGNVRAWSIVKFIKGWFGTNNQGGGIAITDVDGDGQHDLIVFHIDNPSGENQGYYRVIKDVSSLF